MLNLGQNNENIFIVYPEPRDRECTVLIVKLNWGTSQKTSEQTAEQFHNWGIIDLNDVIILVQITAFVHPPKNINKNYVCYKE